MRGKFTIPSGFYDYGDLKTQSCTEFQNHEEYIKYKPTYVGMKTKCPYCQQWVFWSTSGALPTTMDCNSCGAKFYFMSPKFLFDKVEVDKDGFSIYNIK